MSKKEFRGILKQKEATIRASSVMVLLIVATLSTMFVLMPEQVSAADDTLRQENYDDDTPGGNPSGTWYSYSEDSDLFEVSNTYAHSGSNSLRIWGSPSSNEYSFYTLNTNFNGTNFSMWFYVTEGLGVTHESSYFNLIDEDDTIFISFQTGQHLHEENAVYFWYDDPIQKLYPEWEFTYNTWHQLGVNINYTTHKYQGWMTNETDTYYTTWLDFLNNADSTEISVFRVGCTDDDTYMLIDDIQFGAEGGETPSETASSLTLTGLDGDTRINWLGDPSTLVWSNATSYGTLNINYNINSTDNCTEMRVHLDDIDTNVDADTVTLYVSSDNSNFAVLEHNPGNGNGVFPTNGGNLSINESTWPSSGAGTNPFPIDAAGWTNDTINCRFTCNIPAVSPNTYTQDDWKVWWKIES